MQERFGIWGGHHPIDLVQTVADRKNWLFERVEEERITLIVEGDWQQYSIGIDLSCQQDMLNLICAFDMSSNETVLPSLYETLNLINVDGFAGGFSYWQEQQLLVYRYTMMIGGGAIVSVVQLEQMLMESVSICDRYYPVFQLVGWDVERPVNAMNMAIPATVGRA